MKIIFSFLSLFACLLISEAAVAEQVLTQNFGKDDSCYARQYSAEHMAENPDQTVSFIKFGHFPSWFEARGILQDASTVPFTIEVNFKNDNQNYMNGGECRPHDDDLKCQIECDGGGFVLKHKDADSILLYTRPEQGFAVAGCDGNDYRSVTDKTDDKIFLLRRLPAAQCEFSVFPE